MMIPCAVTIDGVELSLLLLEELATKVGYWDRYRASDFVHFLRRIRRCPYCFIVLTSKTLMLMESWFYRWSNIFIASQGIVGLRDKWRCKPKRWAAKAKELFALRQENPDRSKISSRVDRQQPIFGGCWEQSCWHLDFVLVHTTSWNLMEMPIKPKIITFGVING